MKAALIGATKGMGRSLARRMAERGDQLFLLGRNSEDLTRSAAELEVHDAEGPVKTGSLDLLDPNGFASALAGASEALGGIDAVIVTAGQFATQDELEVDTARTQELLTANFVNTILLCEEARKLLLAEGGGTLVVFSSVAGERGRKPTQIYGASKAGLTRYLESMDHRYRSEGLITVTVKPGFVKTGATANLDPPPFAGEPDDVAVTVLKGIDKGAPVVYAPPIWGLVMFVIRLLPRAVMRRIGF